VHDSRVRRIATITPDMVCPKPHDFSPGVLDPTVRESNDNIPIRTRRVRVQTVNANRAAKKCPTKYQWREFYENESTV
jgi:hypothetical protein